MTTRGSHFARARVFGSISAIVAIALAGCTASGGDGDGDGDVVLPDVDDATFVAGVTNTFFPLPVGATWTYVGVTDEGTERIEIEVLPTTHDVHGVTAVVVRDTAFLDDVIIELTDDWYAQDDEGNVWYLGEDTCEYEGGECVDHAGAWEWGVDGALPGIIMPADPAVDDTRYYQEYYPGEAEDVGEVIAVDESVTVPAGSFTGCVRTRDTSTLDPELLEEKVYCPGVGNVLVEEPDADIELTEVTFPE